MISVSVIVGATLLYYAWIGVKSYPYTASMDDYFIYSRQMRQADFRDTFIATTLSLATELTFYLSFGANAGLATFWAPVTFIVGTLIFIQIIQRFSDISYGRYFIMNGDTIIDFLRRETDNQYRINSEVGVNTAGNETALTERKRLSGRVPPRDFIVPLPEVYNVRDRRANMSDMFNITIGAQLLQVSSY